MINSSNFHLLIDALAWPVVTLVAVVVFRKPVCRAFDRVIGFKSDYVQFEMLRKAESAVASNVPIKTERFGNIYWAGSDAVETIMRLLNGLDVGQVFNAVRQLAHHIDKIGADKIPEVGPRLAEIYNRLESMPSVDLTPEVRHTFARDIQTIMFTVGATIESAQPEFKSQPAKGWRFNAG